MIEYSTLPGSLATSVVEPVVSEGFYYTVTPSRDEAAIYQELNERLTKLETSIDVQIEELQEIEKASTELIINVEAKGEVELRIDWLKRLCDVKEALPFVSSYTEAKRLRTMLSPVQTCPMKSELLKALDGLVVSLPDETESILLSARDKVMEVAIEQSGEDFVNLGKAGREYVINDLLKKFGDVVPMHAIQEAVLLLENQVVDLTEIEDTQTLQLQLVTLPLFSYLRLSSERKQVVAEELIENRKWKGLASLDRLIHQLDAKLNVVDEEEQFEIMNDYSSSVLDVKHLDSGKIQFNRLG
ncbi:hypothetical protein CSV67_09145 [Sporosarcina sp. P2]|uniref:hypothetical protein n=1 Tax=Sporosarcina sp. P2 TaxID=2048251 RepID=UPI000C163F6C|nr:hypothetical protein [Sporosarcina sp. P2]PID02457.1 hypothetical protein CSV67_09145 [Sporosarcina sp. P2]